MDSWVSSLGHDLIASFQVMIGEHVVYDSKNDPKWQAREEFKSRERIIERTHKIKDELIIMTGIWKKN